MFTTNKGVVGGITPLFITGVITTVNECGEVIHMKEKLLEQLKSLKGDVSFYYKNLITGEAIGFNEKIPLQAASVIKIPILIEAFLRISEGTIQKEDLFTIKKEDKLPSCGALNYMHDDLNVTFEDLYTLMIILSDNTATNLLIKQLGMDKINYTMQNLGLKQTKLNRLLFDAKQSALGIENYISAGEMGYLLEKMYFGELISPEASLEMLRILKNQRLNGKIPFYIHGRADIAHKTGEDDGITHDVGIVYAPQPFVVCFCSNNVDVPVYERLMQEVTLELVEMQDK
ncbi:serine hydrolase [Anaerocolumna sp. MB42-C2]|uniref:serine hydrolase n=1 Tax=Anaerocolumna sp. MB42-C2 TaxID=3070997 RepID=UPI0027E16735|nr:serine hydrolase [Anaerocolumna sp. MB42-C2]WMJ89390.1 serine hydrolase [Anaerocolumna sp. MB42-C2]